MKVREIIKNEVLSEKPIDIGLDDLESITKDIIENYWWCLSQLDVDACKVLDKIVKEFIDALSKVRTYKYLLLNSKNRVKAFDTKPILELFGLIDKLYNLYLKGYVDSENTVLVLAKEDVVISDIRLSKGAIIPIPILFALMLRLMGVVEILEIQ